MATVEEGYLGMEIQQDLMRLLPNLHENIAVWRTRVAAGQTNIGPQLTASAKSFLGRLRRLAEFAQAETAVFDAAIAPLGVTRAHLNNRVTALRDALRIFRDAIKTTGPEITAAINALEAAVPVQKRFLSATLPEDW